MYGSLLFLLLLLEEAWQHFVLFQRRVLRDRICHPLEKWLMGLLGHYHERVGFSMDRFPLLQCNPQRADIIWCFFVLPWGAGTRKCWCFGGCDCCDEPSSVSEPHVFCQHSWNCVRLNCQLPSTVKPKLLHSSWHISIPPGFKKKKKSSSFNHLLQPGVSNHLLLLSNILDALRFNSVSAA